MKKFIFLNIILIMAILMFGCSDKNDDISIVDKDKDKNEIQHLEAEGELTFGINMPFQNEFFTSIWNNNISDSKIRQLIHGLNIVAYDSEKAKYQIDKTVTKSFEKIENSDKSITFKIVLNDGLKYNDGSEITAKDYIFSVLLHSHPLIEELGADNTTYNYILGHDEYASYEKNSFEGQISKEFKGVRLIDEHTFSITIKPENMPYYHELSYLDILPFPIDVIAPKCSIKDDNTGAYIDGMFNLELLDKTLNSETNGFRKNPKKTSGPYMLENINSENNEITLSVNDKYVGNYLGEKPQIAKLKFKYIDENEQFNALVQGNIDVTDSIFDLEILEKFKNMILEKPDMFKENSFYRAGYGKIVFSCDVGATKSQNVRKAIAYCLDLPNFAKKYSLGNTQSVYGLYGYGSKIYIDNMTKVDESLNKYEFNLEKATKLLEEDGWVLNENGKKFENGKDLIRYRLADKKLEPLVIRHLAPENSEVANLIEKQLVDNMAKIGMKYEKIETKPFVILDNLYNNVPNRTFNMTNLAVDLEGSYNPLNSFEYDEIYYMNENINHIREPKLFEKAMAMAKVNPDNTDEYFDKWLDFQISYNDVLPDIPLYSNKYSMFYSSNVENMQINALIPFSDAVLKLKNVK